MSFSSSNAAGPPVRNDKPWRISDEPIINFVHHWGPELLLALYASAMVYMSFVPFEFIVGPAHEDARSLLGLSITAFSLRDALSNIGYYLPLGGFGFVVLQRRGMRSILSALVVILFIPVMSFLIETQQRWLALRIASWVDVCTNAIGGALGVLIFLLWEQTFRRAIRQAREAVGRDWWGSLAKTFVCIVLLVQLRPYDPVVDLVRTAKDLRSASVSPFARWGGLRAEAVRAIRQGRLVQEAGVARAQWEYALNRSTDVGAYAAVTVLLALAFRRQYHDRRLRMYAWCGFVTMALATLVMLTRIFLISHGLDTAHVLCGAAGWLIGCALARAMLCEIDKGLTGPQLAPDLLPGRWPIVAIVYILIAAACFELAPMDIGSSTPTHSLELGRFIWMPFLAHFHSRPNDALYDISNKLLRYFFVGLSLGVLFRAYSHVRWRRQLAQLTLLTVTISLVFECIHLFMISRHSDVTTVFLAGVGGFSAMVVLRWIHDYHVTGATAFADDLLTSRLIEGESYDKSRDAIVVPQAGADKV